MSTATLRITRADHGRRMTWDEYIHAEHEEGLFYELSRGILTMIDVPHLRHGRRVCIARRQFDFYWTKYPKRIHFVAGGGDCRLLIESLASDRHPDLAIYKTVPPADVPADEFWSSWVPEIVVEVASRSSVMRDYEEKPEEYFRFGVTEYWIVDPEKREMLVHRRRGGGWKMIVVRPGDPYKTPLLRDFEFDLAAVLAAGDEAIAGE